MNIHEAVQAKRDLRKRKIAAYADEKRISTMEAAIFIDFNGPITTNKKMLNSVGFIFDEVNDDNVYDIIEALEVIGVIVVGHKSFSKSELARRMEDVINEEVNECWGGPDMQEYVDLSCGLNYGSVSVGAD